MCSGHKSWALPKGDVMFFGSLSNLSVRKLGTAFAVAGLLLVAACDTPEEKVQNHYESGQALLKEGNLIKAKLEFRNALQINGKFVPALYALGLLEERDGKLQQARGLMSRVLDLEPKHYEASIKFGKFMLVAGQLDKALELSDTVMSIDGTTGAALAFRAAILYKLEDSQGAITNAKKALEVDPANIEAVAVLAAERIAAKDFQGAVAFLDQGLKLNEKNVTLNLIKIQALGALENNDQAEDVLKQLIEFYPEARGFKTALVRFYLRQKRVDEAEKIIRSIAEAAPDDLQANLDVVRFMNTLRGVEFAEKELKLLAERGGKNVFPYQLALARLQFATGKREDAKKLLLDVIATAEADETKLEAKNRLAELQLADGKPDEAAKLVADILTADGQNADALMIRASMRMSNKKIDDAVSDLRTVLKGSPDSIRALMMLGGAHELNGSIELADDRMTGAFQASKFAPQVGLAYARFLMKNGAIDRAEDALIKVLIKSPRQIPALRALAQVRISRQNWLGAQEVADILTQLGDDKSVTSQIMGVALEGQEKVSQSISAFEKAQAATPDALRPMVALVRAYIRNGERDRAENFINSVLKATGKNLFAKILLAQLHALNGKLDLAEATFKEVISENPDNVVGYTTLASYYLTQQKVDEARNIVEQGLDRIAGNVSLGMLKANMLERDLDFSAALSEYEQLYKKSPNSEIVINNLASMLTEYSTDDVSINRAYELAKRFRGSNIPHFKDTLGWIQYRRGNFEEAASLLRDVVEKAPNLAIFRYHLGMAYRGNEQSSSAIRELERALELSKSQPLVQEEEVRKILEELRAPSAPAPSGSQN